VDLKEVFTVSCFAYDPEIIDNNTGQAYKDIYPRFKLSFMLSDKELIKEAKQNRKRIIFVGNTFQRDGDLDENCRSIRKTLDKNFVLQKEYTIDGIKVLLYNI